MIISHNMQAMNSLRQYNIVNGNFRKSTERLSSGYRINRAADDAAGLAISETMRSQIRGLARGVNNCSDGISLCQVVDGAIAEVDDMIHRMRELSVQAINGTNCDSDREALDNELQQLKKEIDRIGYDTEFNTIPVLQGSRATGRTITENEYARNYELVEEQGDQMTLTYTGQNNPYLSQYFPNVQNPASGDSFIPLSNSPYANVDEIKRYGSSNYVYSLDFSTINSRSDWEKIDGASFTFICTAGCRQEFSFLLDNSDTDTYLRSNKEKINNTGVQNSVTFTIGTKGFHDGSDLVNKLLDLIHAVNSGGSDPYNNKVGHTLRADTTNGRDLVVTGMGSSGRVKMGAPTVTRNQGKVYKLTDTSEIVGTKEVPEYEGQDIIIQYGYMEGDELLIRLPHIDCEALEITHLSVATADMAEQTLEVLDDVLDKVNDERSRIGAYTNRIEFTMRSEDNTGENTQAAESRIRDLDMADEVVTNSKYNVLLQVGESVLAQANQSKESVLQLLQ